ncbi:unnamed protein product, partial [Schistosoma mattheei]
PTCFKCERGTEAGVLNCKYLFSKDISSSAGSHVVHSLKSNVDGNSLKTVLLDEDLSVHLHSNVLPNLTPDCTTTTTTTPSTILINPSRINTLSFNTSSNPVNSVMGNQHDTHVPISNDSIKPPINVNIDVSKFRSIIFKKILITL